MTPAADKAACRKFRSANATPGLRYWQALLIFLLVNTPGPVAADELTPHQLIMKLADRIYVISEVNAKHEDYVEALHVARERIRDYVANGGNAELLIEKNQHGLTPLMVAATRGYADVAEELLKYDNVVRTINATDNSGISAWTYANFAFAQTISLCNPKAFENVSFIPSLVVLLGYYIPLNGLPFRKTRNLLEDAGAAADMNAAKDLWLTTCKYQQAETRTKVLNSEDLLDTVITENQISLSNHLSQRQRGR